MTEEQMPVTEHLSELRRRIIFSILSLVIWFALLFGFSEHIFEFLTLPLKSKISFIAEAPFIRFIPVESNVESLVFLAPAEAFWMHIKVSLVSAFILSLPVILFQVWKFISPGLLPKERKYVGPFIMIASSLFVMGAAFCFLIVLPFAMGFLLNYKVGTLTPMISVGAYVDFCLKFIVAFGLVFELPIVIVFLTRMGIVTPRTLSKNRKYAVLISFVIAAILTPTPDAFNQTLMAGPIMVLYEIGILASKLFRPKEKEDG
ncbi:MAG: twin-arginine translocase subunit TatC [Nitrospirota bacterium]|nr:MAG: twin-arginine translocase subunit TatC [Nitrospirota bacterium]